MITQIFSSSSLHRFNRNNQIEGYLDNFLRARKKRNENYFVKGVQIAKTEKYTHT
jgi:hypothetical protein